MIMSGYKQEFLLFNLDIDPYEQNNLAVSEPEKLQELVLQYNNWNDQLVPAKWYDPHPENILKEENSRKAIRENAAKGETKKE